MNHKNNIIIILSITTVIGGLLYLNNYYRIQSLKQGIFELETMNSNLYTVSQKNLEVSDLQIYQNATYGFSFKYPTNISFVTPTYPNLEDKILQIQILQSDYPKTNFGDAAFAISATYAKSLTDCLSLNAPENGDGFKTPIQINGTTFYKTTGSGVGAGNLYENTTYRTLLGNQMCVELNETIHTSNIANYPSDTVTEVDKSNVQKRLNQILSSFKLN